MEIIPMRYTSLVLFFCLTLPWSGALAEVRCLDSDGEAVIVNNDLPSAKAEAVARAKWAAVEQAVGVEVKAQSVVQNMMLVDEAVNKQVNGVVASFKVLQVKNTAETVTVKVNACVEPNRAKDAVAGLALNNSIAVFIPARKPGTAKGGDEYEEANILSETLISRLTDQGYTVVDVAPTHALDAAEMEKALKSGNFLSLRTLMYKFLANVLLIGKVDYTISTKRGEDVGYGLAMPFNNVTVRLTYRLITRDPSGKMVILTAGTEQGKGMAGNTEDAAAKGLKELSEKLTPVILDKVGKYIQGVAKRVEVKVSGIAELSDNFAVKDVLQNIAWVTKVEEKGLGEFTVSYPENAIYLANSISQKGNFKVEKFTPYAITLKYTK
jgi:hypothetical protein